MAGPGLGPCPPPRAVCVGTWHPAEPPGPSPAGVLHLGPALPALGRVSVLFLYRFFFFFFLGVFVTLPSVGSDAAGLPFLAGAGSAASCDKQRAAWGPPGGLELGGGR